MTQSKVLTLLQSRKFWSLIAALVSLGVAYQTGQMPLPQVELGVVAALSGFSLATGIEDAGQAQTRATPSVATINVPPSAPLDPSATMTHTMTFTSGGTTSGSPSTTKVGPFPVTLPPT